MTQHDSRDEINDLRLANVHPTTPLTPEVKARLWAQIQEDVMSSSEARDTRAGTTTGQRFSRWALVFGAVAAAGLLAVTFALGGGRVDPSNIGRESDAPASNSPATGMASCVETYSVAALAQRSWAFDGTVTNVAGDNVTFAVNETFRGDLGADVTVTATGSAVSSAGGPVLEAGRRYLVAGEGKWAWACGFTQPYEAEVAAEWRDATR